MGFGLGNLGGIGRLGKSTLNEGGGWTPAHLDQSKLAWVDFSDSTTLTLDTGISAVTNKGGYGGASATQGTGANQPAVTTLNGRAAALFDGSNDRLAFSSQSHAAGPLYYWAVVKRAVTTSTFNAIFSAGWATTSGFGLLAVAGGTADFGTKETAIVGNGYNSGRAPRFIGGPRPGWTRHKDTAVLIGGLSANGAKRYEDGVEITARVGSAGDVAAVTAALTIGAETAAGASLFNGTIGEVGVYRGELTANEITNLQTYLERKWATVRGNGAGPYIMTAFSRTPADENLFVLSSTDGIDWERRISDYIPNTGYVRDPSVFVDANGVWWVAHTNGTGLASGTTFSLAKSVDGGINWTHVTNVDCSGASGNGAESRVWAPEWFIDDDDSIHVIFAASGPTTPYTTAMTQWEINPTNAGMTTWSAPTEITGTSFPARLIDAFIVKIGATYYMFTKNDATGFTCLATSSSLTSGYTFIHVGDWTGWGTQEGVCIVHLGGSSWRAYMDSTVIKYSDSHDDFDTWSTPVAVTAPFVPQHGTVIRI